LSVHEDEKGKQILKGMMIDKFVVIDDSAYNSIREMKKWVSKQEKLNVQKQR
jgi:phosphonate transport system substrate-binding protein